MYFDRNISEKGSSLSCVTNGEFHFSSVYFCKIIKVCLSAYHRCKPPSQLGGNEHSSKGHGHVEKGVAVGSLPKLVADDALERKIKLKGR